jgi:hypothetical protein
MGGGGKHSARRRPPTADRLRADIDSGLTGDKVTHSDPAVSPLGTDDEAAGTPVSNEQLRLEEKARPKRPAPQHPENRGLGIYVIVMVAIVGLLTLAIWINVSILE